ncbi:hypothetical protein, partial [Leclercia adecarboxylata]|uniref:hypothetical protein n=1 Tax=Leclercia adecarboxylata TaxID=83655 RepID=UPI001C379F2B
SEHKTLSVNWSHYQLMAEVLLLRNNSSSPLIQRNIAGKFSSGFAGMVQEGDSQASIGRKVQRL